MGRVSIKILDSLKMGHYGTNVSWLAPCGLIRAVMRSCDDADDDVKQLILWINIQSISYLYSKFIVKLIHNNNNYIINFLIFDDEYSSIYKSRVKVISSNTIQLFQREGIYT